MEQRSSSLEEIMLHRAMEQSHLHYGGQGPDLNPLEKIIAREADEEDADRQRRAEILLAVLTFLARGVTLREVEVRWRRINPGIPEGYTVHRIKKDEANDIFLPSVEIRKPDGTIYKHYEPARLKSIYKPRKGRRTFSAEIQIQEITNKSVAIRIGTRLLSMAQQGGVDFIREMSGQGIADALDVTRQAVSLTNKAIHSQINEATGGKSGARGLRHKADPRKGKTLEQINGSE